MDIVTRLHRPVQRLLDRASLMPSENALATDIVCGISESKGCHLSAIARTLEEDVPPIRTEQRLSKQLAKFSSNFDALPDVWLRHVAPVARRRAFVAVDMSDLSKPHGRAFEYLDTIRDASSPQKEIEPGYWLVSIDASDDNTHARLPLWMELFSTRAPSYPGWMETVHRAILAVARQTNPDARWLFDRGFDHNGTFDVLDFFRRRWTIRLKRNRHVTFGDPAGPQTENVAVFAAGLRCPHSIQSPYVDKSNHTLASYPALFGVAPGPTEGNVQRAAVGAGACGPLMEDALAVGADLYLTGELRHHDALRAAQAGMTVVCTLHSNSERAALRSLQERLREQLPALDVLLSHVDRDPFLVA